MYMFYIIKHIFFIVYNVYHYATAEVEGEVVFPFNRLKPPVYFLY